MPQTAAELRRIRDQTKVFGLQAVGQVGGFFGDFRRFIDRGNVVDLAIGVILGAAFGSIVASLVADIFSPILGLMSTASLQDLFIILRYKKDSNDSILEVSYPTVAKAKEAGAITLNYGNFMQSIINFLIVSFCLFLFMRMLFVFQKIAVDAVISTDWPCPKCKEKVKEGAVRCPHCAAEPISPAVSVNEVFDERVYLDKT